MDDIIESKLSMSLDALIKQQKKNLPKKAQKKKPSNRRQAPGNKEVAQANRGNNPNQRNGRGKPAPPLKITRAGGILKKNNRAPVCKGGNGRGHPRRQQQHRQQQNYQQHNNKKKNRQPRQKKQPPQNQPRQQQQQQQQQHYNPQAPPGFGGPPAYRHNPYQDALYAKSTKPLFIIFDELQRVPMDEVAMETVLQQPDFLAGPTNKHGVRLPV